MVKNCTKVCPVYHFFQIASIRQMFCMILSVSLHSSEPGRTESTWCRGARRTARLSPEEHTRHQLPGCILAWSNPPLRTSQNGATRSSPWFSLHTFIFRTKTQVLPSWPGRWATPAPEATRLNKRKWSGWRGHETPVCLAWQFQEKLGNQPFQEPVSWKGLHLSIRSSKI